MGSDPKGMEANIKDSQHFKKIMDSVQIFSERLEYTDLRFVCARGHRVFAHKLLLSAVSSRMKQMFMECPDSIDMITVHVPDVEARVLRLLLKFLYEGSLRVRDEEYVEMKNLMNLLGIVLHQSANDRSNQSQSGARVSFQSQQPAQPQPVLYIQAPGPNSQGQVQYMLATSAALSQGHQMMQVAQAAAPGQMMQVAAPNAALSQGQMMQVAAPATSLAQGQVVQMAPAIISQANGQMGGSQVVTTPIQQNSMMQVVPTPNPQMVPIVANNQMVQCSSQMVVQVSQPGMISNNHMQGNVQNQVAQPSQSPQYVMASTTNQMTTSRAQARYPTPQRTAIRSQTTAQATQPVRTNTTNTTLGWSTIMQDIYAVLQAKCNNPETIENLTAKRLRGILEPELGLNLSSQERLIEQVLESFRRVNEEELNDQGKSESAPKPKETLKRKPGPAKTKNTQRKKKKVVLSDDDDDEDFDPSKA